MHIGPQLSVWLLQGAQLQDTIVAKTMPAQRSWFDYTSGTLQLIVLLLAVVVLGALAFMLVSLKRGLDSLKVTVEKLYADSRPIIAQASQVAGDAREVVAMLRTDVERVTQAAGELSEQLLDVAASTEQRMDDINAVIDVVQDELEETALSATAALRGVRLGGRALAGGLGSAITGALKQKKSSSRSQRRDEERRSRDEERRSMRREEERRSLRHDEERPRLRHDEERPRLRHDEERPRLRHDEERPRPRRSEEPRRRDNG